MLVNQKCLRQRSISPLRFPGGKSRAAKKILPYFPDGLKSLVSPFIGGASLEILMARSGVKVFGYDVFEPLVSFWQEALANSATLAETVYEDYWPMSSERFRELQGECLSIEDRHQQAAVFFRLNRASFSGAGLSGGCPKTKARYTESAIAFLRDFKCAGLRISKADFRETLSRHPTEFAYLDPPYCGPETGLYGENGNCHKGFDHRELAGVLNHREHWILSYDDQPLVRDLYREHLCVFPHWKYGMSKNKNSNELLIFSHDLTYWAETVAEEKGDVLLRLQE